MLEISSYILIIEDESDIRELVTYHLEKNSFSVKQAKSAEEALTIIDEQKPMMIILDLMLPKMPGLELCSKLKRESQTKDISILMLTAKSEKEDIIKGLEMGADDYVTKPFDVREVVARVRALLRRKTSAHELGQPGFSYKKLKIDWERHKVYIHAQPISLTLMEFKILKCLIQNQGRVLTRDRLLDGVLGKEAAVVDRTIDVHIQSLRKKIGEKNQYIETIRGIGYRFMDE